MRTRGFWACTLGAWLLALAFSAVGCGDDADPVACDPSSCPGEDTACAVRACDDAGECTVDFVSRACSDNGGSICDGQGACVACVTAADCPDNLLCSAQNTCLPATCSDAIENGNESDIDCGGDCSPCTNGFECGAPSDCETNFCDGGKCGPCGTNNNCATTEFCDLIAGTCLPKIDAGEMCTASASCVSGICADGVCCDSACSGDCVSCVLPGSEGVCTPAAAGDDTDGDCDAGDSCNGAGACSCEDGVVAGLETDVDCGGGVCRSAPTA